MSAVQAREHIVEQWLGRHPAVFHEPFVAQGPAKQRIGEPEQDPQGSHTLVAPRLGGMGRHCGTLVPGEPAHVHTVGEFVGGGIGTQETGRVEVGGNAWHTGDDA